MRTSQRVFVLTLLMFGSLLRAAPQTEEDEIRHALLFRIVDLAETSMVQWDQLKGLYESEYNLSHHYMAPARVLAWVYKTAHPENPFFGNSRVRDVAIEMGDILANPDYRGQGSFEYHGEWPFYNLCQTYELLEDELPDHSQRLWRECAEFYMETRGRRPMFYTAYNHEAGNVAAVLRAGQVFGVPEWESRARKLVHQLVKIQRDLGYFDEGPHHGPSMRYNHIQLTNMLLCDFGELAGGSYLDKRATFFPRAVNAVFQTKEQSLTESFGQGDLRFRIHPRRGRKLTLSYEYDLFSTKTIFVQLPLVVFHNSSVSVDGSRFEGEQMHRVRNEVRLMNPTTRTEVRVVPPKGSESAVRPFIEPLRSYGVLEKEQYHRPYYKICLLSVKVSSPQGRGGGEFHIEVADLK